MDSRKLLNRRATIKAAVSVAAATALPATVIASGLDTAQRIEQAAGELARAMQAHFGNQFDAVVSPDGALWFKGRNDAPADQRLHQLIAAWRVEYDAVTARCDAGAEIDMDALWAIENEAKAIRPVTLEGLAVKLLILTNFGEYDLEGGPGHGMVAEAEAIAGYARPATFKREA